MQKNQKVFKLVTDISLRREEFGGLAFVPITGGIIQLNHRAYNLLKNLSVSSSVEISLEDLSFWQELEARGIVKEVTSNGPH